MTHRSAASERGLGRLVRAAAAIGALAILQACGSPPTLMAPTPATRAFHAPADLARIQPGMSTKQVEEILGKPLNVVDLDKRYDYLIKTGSEGKPVRFVAHGVFLSDGRVVKVEPLVKPE